MEQWKPGLWNLSLDNPLLGVQRRPTVSTTPSQVPLPPSCSCSVDLTHNPIHRATPLKFHSHAITVQHSPRTFAKPARSLQLGQWFLRGEGQDFATLGTCDNVWDASVWHSQGAGVPCHLMRGGRGRR